MSFTKCVSRVSRGGTPFLANQRFAHHFHIIFRAFFTTFFTAVFTPGSPTSCLPCRVLVMNVTQTTGTRMNMLLVVGGGQCMHESAAPRPGNHKHPKTATSDRNRTRCETTTDGGPEMKQRESAGWCAEYPNHDDTAKTRWKPMFRKQPNG